MKKLICIELKKAFSNKLFIAALIMGILIVLQSFKFNYDIYINQQNNMQLWQNHTDGLISNPRTEMFTSYNAWIGGEAFSLGSAVYYFIFPLLIALPYGWSYCEEKQNGYRQCIIVRSGKLKYLLAKYVVMFLSGGVTMVLPLLVSFLLAALVIPSVTPFVLYDTAYGVFGGSLMSSLYYTKPLLYLGFYMGIDFVFCGLLACTCFSASIFIKRRAAVIVVPLFLTLAVHYARQIVYTSSIEQYCEISPLYFLRPVQAAYRASWYVIIVEAAILFAVTFFTVLVWEKRREVY